MEEEREFTEAELTGEEIPDPVPAVEPTGEPAAPQEPAKDPAPAEPSDPKKAEEPAEPPPAEPEKGAEKTVPLAALREERAKVRDLRDRIMALEQKLVAPPKDPSKLVEEDPEEAIRLAHSQIAELRALIAQKDMEARIKAEVPDFLNKAPQMEELMLDLGFSEDAVVRIIGATGEDAPKFFKMLSSIVDRPDPKAIREQAEKELIPKITAEITKQLMEKFKITDQSTNIGQLPGSPAGGKLVVNSEEEFANLSPEMQEKWLSGQL